MADKSANKIFQKVPIDKEILRHDLAILYISIQKKKIDVNLNVHLNN